MHFCDRTAAELSHEAQQFDITQYLYRSGSKEAITFVENFQMTGTLFQAAFDARSKDRPELTDNIEKMLREWAFKAGKYTTGWSFWSGRSSVLER